MGTLKTIGIGIVAVAALAAAVMGAWRGDSGYAPTNEISHQRQQPIESVVQPVVFHDYISVLDVSSFAETLAERSTQRAARQRPTWR
jgi:hypothetical protein